MPYQATVVQVMIASPGDVIEERKFSREAVIEWNVANSEANKLVLLPVAWETHAAPDLSGRAQGLINKRLLEKCDLLVGVFWTRLGTPTGEHESGTVEEIKGHISAGRPAMVYFSSRPIVPGSYSTEQYEKVIEFKGWCQSQGLVSNFETIEDFQSRFPRDLALILRDNPYLQRILQEDIDEIVLAEKQDSAPRLSELAIAMLSSAASGNGRLLVLRVMDGTQFPAGNKSFEYDGSRREEAKREAAIEQLEGLGLIQAAGYKREVFEVTQAGFDYYDKIAQQGVDER